MRRYPALFCLAVVAIAQDRPTFRAGTRLVEVDVIVRNRNGPVAGLTKDDFTLLDEGKPQKIALFSVTAARSSKGPSAPLPAGTVSNRLNQKGETPATATILLIDRLNTPINSQRYANMKVTKFLQAHGDRDRLGIYTLGSSVRVIQELTDDPDRLRRAANSVKPQDGRRLSEEPAIDPTGDAQLDQMVARSLEELRNIVVKDRVQTTRDALKGIARHLAKVPGRKNLIWVSGSFPIILKSQHSTEDFSKEVDEAARALNDANIAVYAVDARGLVGMDGGIAEQAGMPGGANCTGRGPCIMRPPSQTGLFSGIDTMNTLTGLTGGRAFYNSNGIDDSIQKAIEDSELTYTLGFYPSDDATDGAFHKLTVRVDKGGADVRARKGYFASKVLTGTQPEALNELLHDSLNATAIGIAVETAADSAEPGSYKIRALVDLHDIHLERKENTWVGAVDVSLFVEGSKTARTINRKIELPEDQLAAGLEKGIEVSNSIHLDGPAGELRVVAQDRSTGAAGSVRVLLGTK